MQLPKWMENISVTTASSKKLSAKPVSLQAKRWKIEIDGQVYEPVNLYKIFRLTNEHPESYTIWARKYPDQPWELIADVVLPEKCGCGRTWKNSNGEYFVHRDSNGFNYNSFNGVVYRLSGTPRCIVCYYKEQHKQGKWVPKEVKGELGLDIEY